ncbi:phosphohydrolase [Ahniella affigens]|uniref:Phosphohydrolase n=1 Tax=Ahniella affigens TaxID=2021234 RepID=A0A2P1PM31_9GAMM|nr:HD domain-containing protein [Ahniella affigens]AVP95889.1 phosphohydrolase [Ahniella affigens]
MNHQHAVPIRFVAAVAFAAEKHRHQRRKDAEASPYINHPVALAQTLADLGGVTDLDVLCAAVLHDTLEDTETTVAELTQHFGPDIAAIVQEVTDDKTLSKAERKQLQIEHAGHASRQAKLVKLADKICNVQDILDAPPANWDSARRIEYLHWSKAVVDRVRGVNPALESTFDQLLERGLLLLKD